MRRLAAIALGLGMLATACAAEPRWCTITGRGPNDTLLYPPIGKAARVSGVVLGRVVYESTGKVVRFEKIFGPAMLSNAVAGQLSQWTVKTDAAGDEPCETLVIVEFRLHVPDAAEQPQSENPSPPRGMMRITVDAETLIISDPGGEISYGNPLMRVWRRVRGGITWPFRKHPKPQD